jgi:hypothetical protein
VALLVAMLVAALPSPAWGLIGQSPLVVFEPNAFDPNLFEHIELEVEANKGIVTASENDRFQLHVTGTFATTTTGDPITNLQWDAPLEASDNLKMASGSTVAIVICINLPEEEGAKLKAVLDQGGSVEWQFRIELVLSTAAGDKTLDFTEVSGSLQPALQPAS